MNINLWLDSQSGTTDICAVLVSVFVSEALSKLVNWAERVLTVSCGFSTKDRKYLMRKTQWPALLMSLFHCTPHSYRPCTFCLAVHQEFTSWQLSERLGFLRSYPLSQKFCHATVSWLGRMLPWELRPASWSFLKDTFCLRWPCC